MNWLVEKIHVRTRSVENWFDDYFSIFKIKFPKNDLLPFLMDLILDSFLIIVLMCKDNLCDKYL